MSELTKELLEKFNTSGPRYTSYPTAPNWESAENSNTLKKAIHQLDQSHNPISIYIHIPFCEKMCWYCGCSVTIRKSNPKVGDEYCDHLFKEIDLFTDELNRKVSVKQIHLGGGTPNYLTKEQNTRIITKLRDSFNVDENAEISVEIDPRISDRDYVQHLRKIGFNRVSMGIQDFDEKVQKAVNRIQPFSLVEPLINEIKALKFNSLNIDLIYGLPHQNAESFQDTINKVIQLSPDRIALYSFAYIPWLKEHQKLLKPSDFPSDDEKIKLFLSASKQFNDANYISIAMDHFAKSDDELATAFKNGSLYRNFMGYTIMPTDDFVGFGLTSIGFIQNHYFQNIKNIKDYYSSLDSHEFPLERQKALNKDDQIRQYVINSLMCRFVLNPADISAKFNIDFDTYFKTESKHIAYCLKEGLLTKSEPPAATATSLSQANNSSEPTNSSGQNTLRYNVTDLGKLFVRNICMGFDAYYSPNNSGQKYSKTI